MFKPDISLTDVSMINVGLLNEHNIRGIILDIDNTLAYPNTIEIPEHIIYWIDSMKLQGFSLALLSNNRASRTVLLAKHIDVVCVPKGSKPLKRGYRSAARLMGLTCENCAVVGDQIFTDILGGNNAGMFTILVKPFSPDQNKFISFKRILEKPLLRWFEWRQR